MSSPMLVGCIISSVKRIPGLATHLYGAQQKADAARLVVTRRSVCHPWRTNRPGGAKEKEKRGDKYEKGNRLSVMGVDACSNSKAVEGSPNEGDPKTQGLGGVHRTGKREETGVLDKVTQESRSTS